MGKEKVGVVGPIKVAEKGPMNKSIRVDETESEWSQTKFHKAIEEWMKRKAATEEVAEGSIHEALEKWMKRKEGATEEVAEGSIRKNPSYGGAIPGYAEYMERLDNELKSINRWEWNDEDLLLSCNEYSHGGMSREDALKELPNLRHYLKEKSQPFDVDVRPKIGVMNGIYPVIRTEEKLQTYKDFAELGIESFNKENDKTYYEVIKVVKVNWNPGPRNWNWYYITFTAKDVSPRGRYRSPKTFQAQVGGPTFKSGPPRKVELCRIKPKK